MLHLIIDTSFKADIVASQTREQVMPTISEAILNSLPGTGREIANKVSVMQDVPNACMVTPNVVYAVMNKNKKLVKRKLISHNTGMADTLIQYFEAK